MNKKKCGCPEVEGFDCDHIQDYYDNNGNIAIGKDYYDKNRNIAIGKDGFLNNDDISPWNPYFDPKKHLKPLQPELKIKSIDFLMNDDSQRDHFYIPEWMREALEKTKIYDHELMMQKKLKETLNKNTEENYYTKKFLIEDANKKIEIIEQEKKSISNILDRINEIKKEEDNLLNNLERIIKGEIK